MEGNQIKYDSKETPEPTLLARLDSLLERYLEELDVYTTLRTQLSSQLSSGFFSLAQAQRSSALPPGRRYGEEMYDARMKAGRRVMIEEEEEEEEEEDVQGKGQEMGEGVDANEGTDGLSVEAKDNANESKAPQKPPKRPNSALSPDEEAPSSPSTVLRYRYSILPSRSSSSDSRPTQSASASASPTMATNPLTQFGILTPLPLRNCQTTTTTALTNTIPSLLNTSLIMGGLEAEIRRVRAELGLNPTTANDSIPDKDENVLESKRKKEEAADEQHSNKEYSRESKDKANIDVPTSPRRSLASRTKVTEPRSRVLKLG